MINTIVTLSPPTPGGFFMTAIQMNLFTNAYIKHADMLSEQAEKLQKKVDQKFMQSIAKCNTHRKAEFANAAMDEWYSLRLLQGWLEGLAEGNRKGTLDRSLRFITIEQLKVLHSVKLSNAKELSLHDRGILRQLGAKTAEDIQSLITSLDKLFSFNEDQENQLKIRKLERELIGCDIPDFFPTPNTLVEKMIDVADIRGGQRVLEPSAGKGDLAIALAKHPIMLDVIEPWYSLRKILQLHGLNLVASDFLDYVSHYDRIVMNPPFKQWISHMRHAYACLSPGGRLVSLAPLINCEREHRNKYTHECCRWLQSKGAEIEEIEGSPFKESDIRQTGIRVSLIVIDKEV
jgi:hypothetical protein